MEILKNTGRFESRDTKLNFLAKNDNIYVMDNHLAAFWCWFKDLDPLSTYTLLHIDRHHDLSEVFVKKGFHFYKTSDFSKMDVDEIIALKIDDYQLLRWDNYIELYNAFNPLTIKYFDFVTPQTLPRKYKGYGYSDLKDWIKTIPVSEQVEHLPNHDVNRIINLDIDVFFIEKGSAHKRILNKSQIIKFAERLKPLIERSPLITICLSPECCGGWENSINMFYDVSKQLNVNFGTLPL